MLIDSCRTVGVWVTMVIVYYSTSHHYGEGWGIYSYIELVGFLGLVMGTLLFNGLFNGVINRIARRLHMERWMVTEESGGNEEYKQSSDVQDGVSESSLKQPQQTETEMEEFADTNEAIPTLTVVHDLSADDFDEYND